MSDPVDVSLAQRLEALELVGEPDWLDVRRRALRRSQRRRPFRRVALVAAAALAMLIIAGVGYAVATHALDAFDVHGGEYDPERIGARVEIAVAGDWSLYAWKSTRGICLGVVHDGEPASSGCGMPVVGTPADQVFKQPAPRHLIGYVAGGADGDPLYVAGPIAENVARVEIELVDGRVLDAPVYEAPATLGGEVDFYFLLDEESADTTYHRHPVRTLRAYDAGGRLLERLQVPSP